MYNPFLALILCVLKTYVEGAAQVACLPPETSREDVTPSPQAVQMI